MVPRAARGRPASIVQKASGARAGVGSGALVGSGAAAEQGSCEGRRRLEGRSHPGAASRVRRTRESRVTPVGIVSMPRPWNARESFRSPDANGRGSTCRHPSLTAAPAQCSAPMGDVHFRQRPTGPAVARNPGAPHPSPVVLRRASTPALGDEPREVDPGVHAEEQRHLLDDVAAFGDPPHQQGPGDHAGRVAGPDLLGVRRIAPDRHGATRGREQIGPHRPQLRERGGALRRGHARETSLD